MNLFPYGKAALVMLVLAILSGGWIVAHPPPPKKATIVMWTFSKDLADDYTKTLPGFYKEHPGVTVDIEVSSLSALVSRLTAAVQADLDVPDMAELEIGSAGLMFRGPVKDVGFLDLTPRLVQSGLMSDIVASRFAPYTYKGQIFGIPQDVHPVMLAYRRDLFEANHIDPNSINTWDDFIKVGKQITTLKDPQHPHYMIELDKTGVYQGSLETILLQRGGGYFDSNVKCIIDNEAAVQAMKFFVPLVAEPKDGPPPIGHSQGDFWGAGFARAVDDGYDYCIICPDWRAKQIFNNCPPLSGKMALMPMPAVSPGGIRTSTWGGNMLGITKRCKNQDLAWQLAVYLYTNPANLSSVIVNSGILPPTRSSWSMPVLKTPDPYWSNEPRMELFAQLAPQVPPQYTAPEIDMAKQKLSQALNDCVDYYEQRDGKVDDAAFTAFIRKELHEKADDVRALMRLDTY